MFKLLTSKIGRIIRNNILIGLFLVTPIGVTVLIANWLFRLITGIMLPDQFLAESGNKLLLRLAALGLALALLFLIGFFVRSFFGKKLYHLSERLLVRIPVFNKLYMQIRHISEAVVARRDTLFREVVLVEYPRKGLYSIGFVTANAPAAFPYNEEYGKKEEWLALFIPTTPNPTSGLMIMANRKNLKTLSISVPDAMKLVVSAGAVDPEESLDERPTLLDKLESWLAREGRTDLSSRHDETTDGTD